jgi:hypothetical protein
MSESTPTPVSAPMTTLAEMMLREILSHSEALESFDNVIAAADSENATLLVTNMREGSEGYDEYVALVEQSEKLLAAIDAANLPNVKVPTAEEVEQATVKATATRTKANTAAKFFLTYCADNDILDAADMLPKNLKVRKGGASGAQTGIKRPRFSSIIASENGESVWSADYTVKDNKCTMSALAAALSDLTGEKVKAGDLGDHAASVKVDDNGVAEFTVTIGERHFAIASVGREK